MNQNTMGYAQAVYRDKTIDPGSAPHSVTTFGALQNLDAAIAGGELPGLPDDLARVLSARGKVKAFADTMFDESMRRGVPATTQLADELTVAAFSTEGLPDADTFRQRMREAWVADQAAQVQSQIVQNVVRDTERRTSAGIAQHLDDYLAVLRAALMAVVDKAREVDATLGGLSITDASAVAKASAKQRDAVAALPVLARQYNRLRMLQRDLLVGSDEPAPGVNASSPERGSSAWAGVFASGLMEFERVTFVDHGPDHDQSSPQRMLAVARRTDVWVPTIDEAEEAWQTMSMPGAGAA